SAASDHGRGPAAYRFYGLLRRNEVYVGVNRPRRAYHVLAGNNFGPRPNYHVHAIHDVWVACLADSRYPAVFDANVCFDYAKDGIHDDRVCYHQIKRALACHTACLTHAVPRALATAKD